MYQIAICDDEELELDKVEQMLKDYCAKSRSRIGSASCNMSIYDI